MFGDTLNKILFFCKFKIIIFLELVNVYVIGLDFEKIICFIEFFSVIGVIFFVWLMLIVNILVEFLFIVIVVKNDFLNDSFFRFLFNG